MSLATILIEFSDCWLDTAFDLFQSDSRVALLKLKTTHEMRGLAMVLLIYECAPGALAPAARDSERVGRL